MSAEEAESPFGTESPEEDEADTPFIAITPAEDLDNKLDDLPLSEEAKSVGLSQSGDDQ